MGRFNKFETTSRFGRDVTALAKAHPELFDASHTSPTIESLADVYEGPILALPMFAVHGQDVRENAEKAQRHWASPPYNRTNIVVVDARRHVAQLGECGSDQIRGMGVCFNEGDHNPKGRNPNAMHRCTGAKGGHPDLIAWDVMEALFRLLEPQKR
jgi:hypothetical protein